MKNFISKSIAVVFLLLGLFAKTGSAQIVVEEMPNRHHDPFYFENQHTNCISQEQKAEIEAELAINIARLRAEGILPIPDSTTTHNRLIPNLTPMFIWPLRVQPGFKGFEPYFISQYPDHDPVAGQLKDFNNDTITYDLPSGGHTGTDIALGPNWWNMMNEQNVDVVAAAAGIITLREDGAFDQNCPPLGGNPPVNRIVLTHPDGTRSWYLHMKNGSLTGKQVGDAVLEGEYLGKVGSSGFSTGPHLHFEVRDASGTAGIPLDPWAGPGNDWNTGSGWLAQKPHKDPAIIDMYTSTAWPVYSACPNPDNTLKANHFNVSGTIFFNFFFRHLSSGQTATLKIFRPDGTVANTYNYSYTGVFRRFWYDGVSYNFTNLPAGTWRWEMVFQGKTYVKFFTVGCTGTELVSLPTSISGRKGWIAGNTVLAGTTVPLTSCTVGATSTVRFEAGVDVLLGPETWVKKGADFRATIDPCNIGGQ